MITARKDKESTEKWFEEHLDAIRQLPAKSPLRLITGKGDRALLTPEIMLEMMLDPAVAAHA